MVKRVGHPPAQPAQPPHQRDRGGARESVRAQALVAISPRRLTIAAMPFFHANAPIGVVVLFSPTPRGFADGLLKTLSQSLRVCALALSELPPSRGRAARAAEDEATAAQPSLLRGLAALKGELARLTEALEEAERQRVHRGRRARHRAVIPQGGAGARRPTRAGARRAARRPEHASPEIEEQVHSLSRRLAAASEAADAAQTQVAQLCSRVAEARAASRRSRRRR